MFLWHNNLDMVDSLIGSELAGYRIERLLGRGGMASVYFAWDTRNNRAVALKVMDERYRETPSHVERFIHEAQTMINWQSPHIVRVYDAGEENQIYYYVMEFIRGLDLAQLLRQYLDAGQLMPYTDVVRIGWAVSEALDYAHARGIIHRDVKPSNVLVSVDGRILLSDFGLVMDMSRGTLGETFGSPAYIAPEQARNSAAAVPQSDIYALGVVLYEMLTGSVPFHDPSPTALALKHLTEEPPRPRWINPRLSMSVEAVLLRALRKQPGERYATGRELMSALERGLGDALTADAATQPQPIPEETQVFHTRQAQAPAPNPVAIPPDSSPQETPRNPPVASGPASGYGPASGPPPPRQYESVRQASGPPPDRPGPSAAWGGAPAVPPPAAAGRRGGFRWGCLALLLAVGALAILVIAAVAISRGGLPLAPATQVRTATTAARPAPSSTPQPAATDQPTETSAPSETPAPPTLTATATETATPTHTPTPVYTLLLARQKQDGFMLVNTGDLPFPLAPIELRDPDRPEKVFITGSDWELEMLKPGECLNAWLEDVKPKYPSGIRCKPVGKVLTFSKRDRFWTEPFALYYNNRRIGICEPDAARCEIDTRPKEE